MYKKYREKKLFEENHFKLAIYRCSIPPGGFHGYLAASSRGGSMPAPCALPRVPAVPPAMNLCAALAAPDAAGVERTPSPSALP